MMHHFWQQKLTQWGSIIFKHNPRWLQVSKLKASAVYNSFWKHLMHTKHVSLNPGKVLASGEWWGLISCWWHAPMNNLSFLDVCGINIVRISDASLVELSRAFVLIIDHTYHCSINYSGKTLASSSQGQGFKPVGHPFGAGERENDEKNLVFPFFDALLDLMVWWIFCLFSFHISIERLLFLCRLNETPFFTRWNQRPSTCDLISSKNVW